jgi:ubiquitin-protein ligase
MRLSPRQRRLAADHEALVRLQNESSIFYFRAPSSGMECYDLHFRGIGLWQMRDGRVVPRDEHHVRVELGSAYPRMMPALSWRTPIFHPNISTGGVVCLGGYSTFWVPSLKLDELCTMLWDMIRYKNFDIHSPYNREAALWVRDQATLSFPLDHRGLRDRISGEAPPVVDAALVHNTTPPPVLVGGNRRPHFPESTSPSRHPAAPEILFID